MAQTLNDMVEQFREEEVPQGLDRLVKMITSMNHWYVLMDPTNDNLPLIAEIEEDGKPLLWLFAYSDEESLVQSAQVLFPHMEEHRYLHMPLDTGVPWMLEYRKYEVYGLRFNEGPYGFYFGLEELE
ncbi:hypothetical protein L2089_15775 [Paenibacillus hunanensis]|uniref:hypothetical protein n=1 Tax=Paenibacillus hunanensis TaxID=539262 RepID=UPI0020263C02|nr:hypothetical protein [Paenibacillus hunanensis]MCL9662153.1 hypothetical protein [Paenibacillus hunanensis]